MERHLMNDLLTVSKKLRKIAELIDELFIEKRKENRKTASEITRGVKPHWMQTSAGRRKLSKSMKAVWAKKRLKGAA